MNELFPTSAEYTEKFKENPRQVEYGFWNPDQGVSENVIREHMPYTYLEWIFADSDSDQLFNGPEWTRRLMILSICLQMSF